eukprot:9282695-Lingulodinium_polyedra.AAC.1
MPRHRVPRQVRDSGAAAAWRWLGAVGRAWRLHGAAAPPELQAAHGRLLLLAKQHFFPHTEGGSSE